MKRAANAIGVGLFGVFTVWGSGAAQGASLSLSSGAGAPGQTVTLALSLASSGGTAPASLQVDLNYSTSDLSPVAGTYYATGAAAAAASKSATCSVISAGDVRCLASGLDATAIGDGVVATISFQISSRTLSTSTLVSLLSPMGSDANCDPLTMSAVGSTVTINQPVVPVLSSLICSPASFTSPGAASCSVRLTAAAASTTAVNLSSGSSAASVPGFVNISPGLSAANFTVTNTSAVSTVTTAIITASLGGASKKFSLTLNSPAVACTYALSSYSASFGSSAATGSVSVTAPSGCAWTVTNNSSFITVTGGASGSGNGTVLYSIAANTGAVQTGSLSIANLTYTVTQTGPATTGGLAYYPLAPCRVVDTRSSSSLTGAFGPPYMNGGSSRSFPIPSGSCNVPSTAQAYALSVSVAPHGLMYYLTIWPTGSPMPWVSTLNAVDGRAVANAAIVPAGSNGAVSVYVNNDTDVMIDISGYFDAPNATQALAFYPLTPCRIADTRLAGGSGKTGSFGPPQMAAGETRGFPVPASTCGIPANAQAYSLNMTVVPPAGLSYLTAWPAGQALPNTTTLNSPGGDIVANAAIVGAGTGGAIDVFVSDATDVIIDINGYFAPAGSPGALYFYSLAPCRIADTRSAGGSGKSGPFGPPQIKNGSTRTIPVLSSSCAVPGKAQAYSLNMTVVPPGPMFYLTTWPDGQTIPWVSTLNDLGSKIIANAAIVPAGAGGAIDVFANNATDLIIDVNGFFAP